MAYAVVVAILTNDFLAGLLALAIVRCHVLIDWLIYHVFRDREKQAVETAKTLLVFSSRAFRVVDARFGSV